MLGTSCIRAYSKGQAVIALSSGEAEYYGLVSGSSYALGDVAIARDWGMQLKAHLIMDATAGIAIGSRRGLGRVRHIDTMCLGAEYGAAGQVEDQQAQYGRHACGHPHEGRPRVSDGGADAAHGL